MANSKFNLSLDTNLLKEYKIFAIEQNMALNEVIRLAVNNHILITRSVDRAIERGDIVDFNDYDVFSKDSDLFVPNDLFVPFD
jgi:hypothetical protein